MPNTKVMLALGMVTDLVDLKRCKLEARTQSNLHKQRFHPCDPAKGRGFNQIAVLVPQCTRPQILTCLGNPDNIRKRKPFQAVQYRRPCAVPRRGARNHLGSHPGAGEIAYTQGVWSAPPPPGLRPLLIADCACRHVGAPSQVAECCGEKIGSLQHRLLVERYPKRAACVVLRIEHVMAPPFTHPMRVLNAPHRRILAGINDLTCHYVFVQGAPWPHTESRTFKAGNPTDRSARLAAALSSGKL